MIIPSLLQYIYGYRYNPKVVNEFSYNLNVIRENLTNENLVVQENIEFYRILEESTDLTVTDQATNAENVAFLGTPDKIPKNYELSRIITSPMRDNSDIIYLYTYTDKKGGK